MARQSSQLSGDGSRLQAWLRIDSSHKPRIYQQISPAAQIGNLTYWLEIFFAAGIATFGLVQNSPAVIIGAMLISPLMGPIMATGLALAIGDLYLGIKAVLSLLLSVTVSILFSAALVWLLPFQSATSEILARTNPNLLDLGIALLSGLAGSVVVCRGVSSGITALPGVAIAVALMPPVCTVGFGLGSGLNPEIMSGAGLLFLTNLVAIVASAFLVFFLVGMSTPEVYAAMLESRQNERLAQVLLKRPAAGPMTAGGQVRWRVLMLVVLLGSIAVPLQRALRQVAEETTARSAVQSELQQLIPGGSIVSQQVTVGQNDIEVQLISTQAVSESKIDQARENLTRRTGRVVQLSIDTVASKGELTELMQRLQRPSPIPPPKEETVAELAKKLTDTVGPALAAIWPASDAPIQSFEVATGPQEIVVDVRYEAARDLGEAPLNMVLKSLRGKLAEPNLQLKTERVRPLEKRQRR